MSFKVFLSRSFQQTFNRAYPSNRSSHAYYYDVLLPVAKTMQDQDCTEEDYVSLILTATIDIPETKTRDTARRDFWYLLGVQGFVPRYEVWLSALASALRQRMVAEVPVFADHGCDPRSNDIRNPFDGTVTRSYCFEGYKLLATLCDILHPVGGSRCTFSVHLSGRWINRYVRCHSLDNPRAMWKQADRAALQTIADFGHFPLSGK